MEQAECLGLVGSELRAEELRWPGEGAGGGRSWYGGGQGAACADPPSFLPRPYIHIQPMGERGRGPDGSGWGGVSVDPTL